MDLGHIFPLFVCLLLFHNLNVCKVIIFLTVVTLFHIFNHYRFILLLYLKPLSLRTENPVGMCMHGGLSLVYLIVSGILGPKIKWKLVSTVIYMIFRFCLNIIHVFLWFVCSHWMYITGLHSHWSQSHWPEVPIKRRSDRPAVPKTEISDRGYSSVSNPKPNPNRNIRSIGPSDYKYIYTSLVYRTFGL